MLKLIIQFIELLELNKCYSTNLEHLYQRLSIKYNILFYSYSK